jgi:hypothetical protein
VPGRPERSKQRGMNEREAQHAGILTTRLSGPVGHVSPAIGLRANTSGGEVAPDDGGFLGD